MTTKRIVSLVLLASSAAAFFGCATKTDKPPGSVADAAEYEYVTPLGSNIPVRVRKGEAAQTSSPTATIGADQAANMMHGAGGQAKVDKGP